MSEPINPRLLARVERSLRKRLNSNVGPHLQRAAAHARSEDDFMAAAGRLLLNPQERHEWLATWTARRTVDGADTAPAELDALPSMPAPLSTPESASLAVAAAPPAINPSVFRLSAQQRERMREALSTEVGPIAEILIGKESQQSGSLDELMQRLEAHLDTDAQRLRFRAFASP